MRAPTASARIGRIRRERRIGRIRRERRVGRLRPAAAMMLMMAIVAAVMVALAFALAATIAVVVVPAHLGLLKRSWKNQLRSPHEPSFLTMPIDPPLGMPIAAAIV
jgi:hypothetical protein